MEYSKQELEERKNWTKKQIEDNRIEELKEAGYNPNNLSSLVWASDIEERKKQLHKKHQEILRGYKK